MSLSSAAVVERAATTDKSPTRPLPRLTLEAAARQLDEALANEDATLTVSPEANEKLLASAFEAAPPSPLGDASRDEHNTDDEPTLEAPAPGSSPEALAALALAEATPRVVRIRPRACALRTLLITKPASMPAPSGGVAPAPIALPSFPRSAPSLVMSMSTPVPAANNPAASGVRRRIEPELVQAARVARRKEPTSAISLLTPKLVTYVVAGIWATALALMALLTFMVTSV